MGVDMVGERQSDVMARRKEEDARLATAVRYEGRKKVMQVLLRQ